MHSLKSAASVASLVSVSSDSEHPHIDWQHAHMFSPSLDNAFTPLISASVSSTTNAEHDLFVAFAKGVPPFPRFFLHLATSLSSPTPSQSSAFHQSPHQLGAVSASEHATASAKHDLPASEIPATVDDVGCAALYVHVSAFQKGRPLRVCPVSIPFGR